MMMMMRRRRRRSRGGRRVDCGGGSKGKRLGPVSAGEAERLLDKLRDEVRVRNLSSRKLKA
jgi:hypothetical protein